MTKLTCQTFTRLIPRFEETATREPQDGVGYDAWCEHMHACAACSDVILAHRVASWNIDPAPYPCIHMAYRANQTCPMHEERSECPDLGIGYD